MNPLAIDRVGWLVPLVIVSLLAAFVPGTNLMANERMSSKRLVAFGPEVLADFSGQFRSPAPPGPGTGELSFSQPTYNVDFTGKAITYRQLHEGRETGSVELELERLAVGGRTLELNESAVPQPSGDEVHILRRPGIEEIYEIEPNYVEQSWLIEKKLGSGSITIDMFLRTALTAQDSPSGGLDFFNDNGEKVLSYSKATVIGAEGRTVDVSPVTQKQRGGYLVRFVFPEERLRDFVYPILIDPKVGSDIGISTTPDKQQEPVSAYDPVNNQFLVAWADDRRIAGIRWWTIFYQMVKNDGTLVGGNVEVLNSSLNNRYRPAVSYNSVDNEFLIVWETDKNGVNGPTRDIYGQRIDTGGNPVGGEIEISRRAGRKEPKPQVSHDPVTNRYLVVFQDERVGSLGYDIWGQVIAGDGTPFKHQRTANFNIYTSANKPEANRPDNEENPDVAYDSINDRFVVVWNGEDGGGKDNIYGRIVTSGGNLAGSRFTVADDPPDPNQPQQKLPIVQANPSIVFNSANGQLLVAWEDDRNSFTTDIDIFGQLISASGGTIGTGANANFAISTARDKQNNPALGYNGSGRFLAVWEDSRVLSANPYREVHGQWIQSDGTLLFSDSSINVPVSKNRESRWPDLALDTAKGQFLIVWSDLRKGTDPDIFGVRFTTSVTPGGDTTPPTVSAGFDRSVSVGRRVMFEGFANDASGVDVDSFLWDFGDGTTVEGRTQTHQFTKAGKYIVTLSAKDKAGNVGSSTVLIHVKEVVRLWGQTSHGTAVRISQEGFPSSNVAIVARGDHFSDALAGGPLAKYLAYRHGFQAPILLTNPGVLDSQTQTEITRLGAETVYVLGGTGAISSRAEASIRGIEGVKSVRRLWGFTAYGTALAIKAEMVDISRKRNSPSPTTAIITTGEDFQDALVISGPAGSQDMPILLVKPFTNEPQAETQLALQGVDKVIIVGGPGAVHPNLERWLNIRGHKVIERLWGMDAQATAVDVAVDGEPIFGFNKTRTILTRGDFFADALSGGSFASFGPYPMLLSDPTQIPLVTRTWFDQNNRDIQTLYILGGPGAVSNAVFNTARTLIL